MWIGKRGDLSRSSEVEDPGVADAGRPDDAQNHSSCTRQTAVLVPPCETIQDDHSLRRHSHDLAKRRWLEEGRRAIAVRRGPARR